MSKREIVRYGVYTIRVQGGIADHTAIVDYRVDDIGTIEVKTRSLSGVPNPYNEWKVVDKIPAGAKIIK